MKKICIIISTIFIFSSCFLNLGTWNNDVCRPKNPNFKLTKIPFKETKLLNYSCAYIGDFYIKSSGFGFLPDGRLIKFHVNNGQPLQKENIIGVNWYNSINIGYWRVDENKIKIEFFICREFGFYNMKQGVIKGDTIIFYENFYGLTGKEVREERYILSDMRFE